MYVNFKTEAELHAFCRFLDSEQQHLVAACHLSVSTRPSANLPISEPERQFDRPRIYQDSKLSN